MPQSSELIITPQELPHHYHSKNGMSLNSLSGAMEGVAYPLIGITPRSTWT